MDIDVSKECAASYITVEICWALRSVVSHTLGNGWRSGIRFAPVGTVNRMKAWTALFLGTIPWFWTTNFIAVCVYSNGYQTLHISVLKIEALCSCETLISICNTTLSQPITRESEKSNPASNCAPSQLMGYDDTWFLRYLDDKIVDSNWCAVFIFIGHCLLLARL